MYIPDITQTMEAHKTTFVHKPVDTEDPSFTGILPHRNIPIVCQYRLLFGIHGNHQFIIVDLSEQMLIVEVPERVEQRLLTVGPFNHPQKNMLTRGIGVNKNVNGDVFVIDIYTDDIILLCSDGLTDMLHDKEITGYLQMEDTEASADALLSASLEKGGKDNISFIILKLDRKEVEHDGR